jgi:hypothetical protein
MCTETRPGNAQTQSTYVKIKNEKYVYVPSMGHYTFVSVGTLLVPGASYVLENAGCML